MHSFALYLYFTTYNSCYISYLVLAFTAKAAGDPHLTTLDGLDYTFNGINDFILVEDTNGSVVIQVRAVQAKDPSGKNRQ